MSLTLLKAVAANFALDVPIALSRAEIYFAPEAFPHGKIATAFASGSNEKIYVRLSHRVEKIITRSSRAVRMIKASVGS